MTKAKDFPAEILRQYFEVRADGLWRLAHTAADGRRLSEKKVELKANHNCGYCLVGFKGRTLMYHRLVWLLANGDIPEGLQLDHRNGDKLDNRLENLHLVTHRENQQNRAFHRAAGRCGYYWFKRTNKWHALIRINGKRIHIGYFTDENEAKQAYNIACELIEVYENKEQFRELVKSKITE